MKLLEHMAIEVCGDCLCYLANGDVSGASDDYDPEDIDAQWGDVYQRDKVAKEHNADPASLRWELVAGGACPMDAPCPMGDDGEILHEDDCPGAEWNSEGSFSWAGCDACGSRLGGRLYPATAQLVGEVLTTTEGE